MDLRTVANRCVSETQYIFTSVLTFIATGPAKESVVWFPFYQKPSDWLCGPPSSPFGGYRDRGALLGWGGRGVKLPLSLSFSFLMCIGVTSPFPYRRDRLIAFSDRYIYTTVARNIQYQGSCCKCMSGRLNIAQYSILQSRYLYTKQVCLPTIQTDSEET
jgi:hypothetical protein